MFIIDDIINAIGATQAAAQQERAAKEAMGLQREVWQQQRSDQAPWMSAGQTGLAGLLNLNSDPSSIANSPAFQFRLSEGNKALERSAAARGGLNSGGFMKGMARYSQGLASDEYGNQWNRLMGLSQMGQGSAQNLGALGSNFANSMSNLYGDKGNAQAAGTMGIAQGAAGGVRSLGNLAMLGLGGGLAGIGIPGLGGGAGPMGSMAPAGGALASMASGYIPRQGQGGLGFNLPQLSFGGGG